MSLTSGGEYLAVGAHDKKIYVYGVSDEGKTYEQVGVLEVGSHSSSTLNILSCMHYSPQIISVFLWKSTLITQVRTNNLKMTSSRFFKFW